MDKKSPNHKYFIESKGLITRKQVKAGICNNNTSGINFISFSKPELKIEASLENINSTQRNTMLAKDGQFICLTEHFMAACSLMNIDNVDVFLSEDELPFGDGSAKLWIDFFKENNFGKELKKSSLELKEEIIVEDGDRFIKMIPAENFKLSYELDWAHPKVGQQSFSWQLGDDINEVACARTFSNESENKMLGLDGWIVGLTEDGFSMPLLFPNEPARHKALDLIGDLYLSGINPLDVKMHVISHKGGHQLNSQAAQKLKDSIKTQKSKSHLKSIILFLLFTFLSFINPVFADEYEIILEGNKLQNISALEIAFDFSTKDSFELSKNFYIKDTETLFKTVDQKNSILRMFFANDLGKQLSISGDLKRKNYKGDVDITIKDISYITKLGDFVKKSDIESTLKIKKDNDILPFLGIVKGTILGPQERIFQKKMFIAITDVETYGFEFNKSIKNIRINGNPAAFLSKEIIFATIYLDEMPYEQELPITLELEVGDKVVKKTIGKIKLLESISS